METFILVLLVSFVSELCTALYTWSVARNKMALAITATVLSSVFSTLVILNVVYNVSNLPAIIIGETAGTVTMLRLAKKVV